MNMNDKERLLNDLMIPAVLAAKASLRDNDANGKPKLQRVKMVEEAQLQTWAEAMFHASGMAYNVHNWRMKIVERAIAQMTPE